MLLTLTIDPSRFGAVRVGSAPWTADGKGARSEAEAVRWTTLWSEPTLTQFEAATSAMSAEWNRLNERLRSQLRRRGLPAHGYFRVIELHRNGWPHYHVVLEHPTWGANEYRPALAGWALGRTDARDVGLDDAVGEVAPYLVASERKAGGSKAYQFAATALPAGFRLHSSSRGFLAPEAEDEDERPVHGIALRGHFTSFTDPIRAMGGTARLALHAPSDDGDHRPPSRLLCNGDAAVVYFAQLADTPQLHAPPEWFRQEGTNDERRLDHHRPSTWTPDAGRHAEAHGDVHGAPGDRPERRHLVRADAVQR